MRGTRRVLRKSSFLNRVFIITILAIHFILAYACKKKNPLARWYLFNNYNLLKMDFIDRKNKWI